MHVVAAAMYGSILMAPVSDVDNCDYFLLVGTNPAVSAWNWLETVPGGWRRALARQAQGATIVVVDPLRTESAEKADHHLAVRPGQDWALLLAMVKVILDEGLEHRQDCTELATGMDELRALVADADIDDLARRCDIDREQIVSVAREFAAAERAMVVTRTGVSMHLAGTVAEWLGHVLNVITGRMDRPGGRRFEPGYVDAIRMSGMVKTSPHRNRLSGREMVAGAHALSELPDEITTPGPRPDPRDGHQLRQPGGVRTRRRRSSTRRWRNWICWWRSTSCSGKAIDTRTGCCPPCTGWNATTCWPSPATCTTSPTCSTGPGPSSRHRVRARSGGSSSTSRSPCASRCSAPEGLNGFIKATRRAARLTRRPGLEFTPHWIDRLVVATGRKFNGRRIRWRDVMAHPHGWVLGPREFGHFREALRTPDKKVQVAPAEFVARARELLAEPQPEAPAGYPVPDGQPAPPALDELLAQRAARPAPGGQAQ